MITFSEDELKQAEIEAKKYLLDLSNEKKKSAVLAIRDLQGEPFCKNWVWINVALHKKSISNWERFGFGLMFIPNFDKSVWQQIERERTFDVDLGEFFQGIEEETPQVEDKKNPYLQEIFERLNEPNREIYESPTKDQDFKF